jgi:hypothetical protein
MKLDKLHPLPVPVHPGRVFIDPNKPQCGAKFPDSSERCKLVPGHRGFLGWDPMHYDGIGWWTDKQADERALHILHEIMES